MSCVFNPDMHSRCRPQSTERERACASTRPAHTPLKRPENQLTAKRNVVKVLGDGDGLDGSTDVELLRRVVQVVDGGVRAVVGSEDVDGLGGLVGLVDIRDWVRAHEGRSAKSSSVLPGAAKRIAGPA